MLAGISKAVVLYLSPVLALTAILLSLFSYIAPSIAFHDRIALATIHPSTVLVKAGPAEVVDGPSLLIGILGSCSRVNNAADLNCTVPAVSPIFDLTVIPKNAPRLLLDQPPSGSPAFIAVALCFTIIFFFTSTIITFRHKMGEKAAAALDKPMIQRVSAWIGFLGFFIGITSFMIIRMWYGKAVDDFNRSIQFMGPDAPKLAASTGNAFTMVWVAYAFLGVPVIVSLVKMNATFTKTA